MRDATVQRNEDAGGCEAGDASVWYRFTAPERGSVIIQLDAAGDLDAAITVFHKQRSQLDSTDCDLTNKLAVLVPSPPARPPGAPLGSKGVKNNVDKLVNPSDAWSMPMTAGRTYKLSLKTDRCMRLSVFRPGVGSFRSEPEKALRCGGYRLFTPERSGRHALLVEAAGKVRGKQRYRLSVKPARFDDGPPGIFIRNDSTARGRVNGRADSVDMYRFDVTSRSSLTLTVTGGPELMLLKPGGRELASRSRRARPRPSRST